MIILKLLPKFQARIYFSWRVVSATSREALRHFLLHSDLHLLQSPL